MKLVFTLLVLSALIVTAAPCATASRTFDLGDGGLYGDGSTLRDIQETIWFQGFLTDDGTGEPVNATYTVTARIYDADIGGSTLWGPEAHVGVQIVDGWFNIELGGVVGGLPSFDAPPYYLQLVVNGESLTPRLKLASVPSAFQSLTADDGLTLPYIGTYGSPGTAFQVTNTGPNIAGLFKVDNVTSTGSAVYGWHTGPGAAVFALASGDGPAVRAVANGDGYAGLFEGAVIVEDSLRVTGLTVMQGNAVVTDSLIVAEGFMFPEGAQPGYVLRCLDDWTGTAEWGPPNVIDVHNEGATVTIGTSVTQYDDAQVELTVPGPGYVVVTSTVQARFDHAYGTIDALILGHSTDPGMLPSGYSQVYDDIPAEFPTVSGYYRTFSVHSTHEVPSAGTYTYYLVGAMDLGGNAGDVFVSSQTTGIYYPYPVSVRAAGEETGSESQSDRHRRR